MQGSFGENVVFDEGLAIPFSTAQGIESAKISFDITSENPATCVGASGSLGLIPSLSSGIAFRIFLPSFGESIHLSPETTFIPLS